MPEQSQPLSAIPLQTVQYLGDFQQGALIVRRQGEEILAELDGLIDYFTDLPP